MRCIVLVLIIAASSATFLYAESFEDKAIAFVKHVPASKLDAELPSEGFCIWLQKLVGPKSSIKWELNDCGEQTGTPEDIGRDFPACVEADALLSDGRMVIVSIAVGTFKKGILGDPEIWTISIEHNDKSQGIRRLSKLPEALNASN